MNSIIPTINVSDGTLINVTVNEARAAGASEADIDVALDSHAWAEVRALRNRLLRDDTDWTQFPDVAESVSSAWLPYRAALRDFPATLRKKKHTPQDALNDPALWPVPPKN